METTRLILRLQTELTRKNFGYLFAIWTLFCPATDRLSAQVENIDALIHVTIGGQRLNRSTPRYLTHATLTNISSTSIKAPIQLVVTAISSNSVSLRNPSEVTSPPESLPLVAVAVKGGILEPGEQVAKIALKFDNPLREDFTFESQVRGVICRDPVAAFDWSMPDRFGLDQNSDGLIDYFPETGELSPVGNEIQPASWTVDFDACASTGPVAKYRWSIQGAAPIEVLECDGFSWDFAEEGVYEVTLTAVDPGGGYEFGYTQGTGPRLADRRSWGLLRFGRGEPRCSNRSPGVRGLRPGTTGLGRRRTGFEERRPVPAGRIGRFV